MMRKKLIIISIFFIFIILSLSGCTQKDSSDEYLSLDEPDNIEEQLEIESLHTVLSKTESIESMFYEIVASIYMSEFGSQSANIKIWQKNPYLKEEITSIYDGTTTNIIVIQRPDGIYMYDSKLGKYTIATEEVTSISSSLQYFDNDIVKKYVENNTLNDFETDMIDGKKATIIQYSPLEGEYPMTIKLWIWNEKGLPLKAYIDMTMQDFSMEMNFEFKDYSFSDVPDSTFNIS